MLLFSCNIFIVLIFVDLVSNLEARPQLSQLPLATESPLSSNVTEPTSSLRIWNKSKERILNSSKRDVLSNSYNKLHEALIGFISFAEYTDPEIVFPDDESLFMSVPKIDGPPKCANGETFCERFDPYPEKLLKTVLQRNGVYREVWGKDEIPVDITNRVGGEDDHFVCGSVDRMVFPKVGKNKNKKWKFIINQEVDGFIQGVRVETCRNHGGPCDIIGELPNGYTTYCKQKYIYRRMLSLSDTGTPIPDTFQLPSACCCAYRRNMDFLARFGALPVTPTTVKTKT